MTAWMRRWGLPALCVLLGLTGLVQQVWIGTLRESNDLLRRYAMLQTQWCSGVERVNRLCEEQFIEIMQRLGLDNEMMPLLTTALWKRATANFPVSKARQLMGAKGMADGFLDKDAIGGPDERACDCR